MATKRPTVPAPKEPKEHALPTGATKVEDNVLSCIGDEDGYIFVKMS